MAVRVSSELQAADDALIIELRDGQTDGWRCVTHNDANRDTY